VYQLIRIAQLIGLNAVPGFGFLERQWSAGTVMALYWAETLLGALLVAARIDIHRRLTHKRGHYAVKKATQVLVNGKPAQLDFLGSFLLMTMVFTLAEGVFLAVLIAQLPDDERIDLPTFFFGLQLIAAFLVAGFIIDFFTIRNQPFFWIHRISGAIQGRVVAMFFIVYLGMFALIFFNARRSSVVLFMVLKTMIDIASELPESQTGEAPQWQLAIASLFGPQAREKFAAYARDANKEYGTYDPSDEEVVAAA
jgi:Family of unknown function (DUF6498)